MWTEEGKFYEDLKKKMVGKNFSWKTEWFFIEK